MSAKKCMTPAEFDEASRTLMRRVPKLSCTSGGWSEERNRVIGGSPLSKHIIDMARDYVGTTAALENGAAICEILGLTYTVHDVGSGNHLHTQGLPVGPIPLWWREKYGEQDG